MYIVDAFTSKAFAGNPAAVCLIKEKLPDEILQKIANEMSLSETAFVLPIDHKSRFSLRWFTPAVEVRLCGHATLATAFVLFTRTSNSPSEFDISSNRLIFETLSGDLIVTRTETGLEMDFPQGNPRS